MKLEKFTKNTKQKRIVISSIVGIILIIGGILLYRSYALYEEEQEFNVLKGQIPDFGYDIKMLSVNIDGVKQKEIPKRGLYKTNVECSGEKTTGKWDYNAWNLVLDKIESNTKCNIRFTSNLTEEEYNQYIEAGVSLRRNTYRGKDISSYWKDGSLYTMISNGTFDDIYVGDYIVDNSGNKWLIADLDNYLYTGDAANTLTKHHATVIAARDLMNVRMNSLGTTEGGYYGSEMKQTTLPNFFDTYVKPVFKEHVLTYSTYLTNSVNMEADSMSGLGRKGSSDGAAWYDSQIDLMSESNVYGSDKFSSSAVDSGIDNRQYAIFQLKPELINSDGSGKIGYWLKNVSSSTYFSRVYTTGLLSAMVASNSSGGVRPRFLID